MSMTLVEKIIADHANLAEVHAGEIVVVHPDLVLANELSGILAIETFFRHGRDRIFDPDQWVFVPDHFVPARDIRAANTARRFREFAYENGIQKYYELGRGGIEHVLLPQEGLIWPGALVMGGDSHTCTYGALGAFAIGVGSTDLAALMVSGELWLSVPETVQIVYRGTPSPWVEGKDMILYTLGQIGGDGAHGQVMEFHGALLRTLSAADRFTMCNMAVEGGAMTGIIPPDAVTQAYIVAHGNKYYDEKALSTTYGNAHKIIDIDITGLEPQVAQPFSPANSVPVSAIGDVPLDQVMIGYCTNGRLEDLRRAAHILAGRSVHPHTRLLITPGSQQVYQQASAEGLLDIFLAAGAMISPPSCGACLGGHLGVLGAGETALSTTNRNFVGRVGDVKSRVYLSNPTVAAASAVAGRIIAPQELPGLVSHPQQVIPTTELWSPLEVTA